MTAYPDEVVEVVLRAVNDHGVGCRIIDGRHLRLYNGDRSVRPVKISAVRPGPDTLRRLLKWLEINVPTWKN